MNSLVLALALSLAAPAAMALAPAQSGLQSDDFSGADETTQTAMALVDAFHVALGRGDTEAALDLLAPDVVIFEDGAAERSRENYASHHLPADIAFAAMTNTEVNRRAAWVEGETAWVLTEGRLTGESDGRPIDRLTAETMVLQHRNGIWLIRHIHWSSRAPE